MSAKSTLDIRAHPRPIFPLTLLQIVYTRTMKNTWKFLGPTLAATAAAVGAGYYWLFRRPLPQTNGTIIMLPIPELNEERRRELTKVAAQYAEHARVAVRNVRRDGMDQIKKAKADGMSEDDQKFWEAEVQELTDKMIQAVDAALEAKQAEIMHV